MPSSKNKKGTSKKNNISNVVTVNKVSDNSLYRFIKVTLGNSNENCVLYNTSFSKFTYTRELNKLPIFRFTVDDVPDKNNDRKITRVINYCKTYLGHIPCKVEYCKSGKVEGTILNGIVSDITYKDAERKTILYAYRYSITVTSCYFNNKDIVSVFKIPTGNNIPEELTSIYYILKSPKTNSTINYDYEPSDSFKKLYQDGIIFKNCIFRKPKLTYLVDLFTTNFGFLDIDDYSPASQKNSRIIDFIDPNIKTKTITSTDINSKHIKSFVISASITDTYKNCIVDTYNYLGSKIDDNNNKFNICSKDDEQNKDKWKNFDFSYKYIKLVDNFLDKSQGGHKEIITPNFVKDYKEKFLEFNKFNHCLCDIQYDSKDEFMKFLEVKLGTFFDTTYKGIINKIELEYSNTQDNRIFSSYSTTITYKSKYEK